MISEFTNATTAAVSLAVRRVTVRPGCPRPSLSADALVRRAADGRVGPGHDIRGTMLLQTLWARCWSVPQGTFPIDVLPRGRGGN